MSADGIVCRIQITDAWASVNDSIAPKAYRLPRNVEFPSMSATATALYSAIATYGVKKRGWMRRSASGNCLCCPIE
jgi:hypothetical protein